MRFHDKPVPPPHIADGRYSLVGPLVTFRGQHRIPVAQTPPRDTTDGDRWRKCTDHHLACDCREAEQNENLNELRMERRAIQNVLKQVTFGHPTYVEQGRFGARRSDLECKCVGCDLIRRLETNVGYTFHENTVTL